LVMLLLAAGGLACAGVIGGSNQTTRQVTCLGWTCFKFEMAKSPRNALMSKADPMRIFVAALLFFGAHFSLTVNLPTQVGKALIRWPFAAEASLGGG